MQQVFIKTLGCKVNTFDSNALSNQFSRSGFGLTDNVALADYAVINSCSVTETAQKEARYLARRYKREKPSIKVIVTGCYAQVHSKELTSIESIDFVIPNEQKTNLVQIIAQNPFDGHQKLPQGIKPVSNNRQEHFKSSLVLFDEAHSTQTRAFLKIQDGCNGFCTYCLIPYARGASKSVPKDRVLAEVDRLMLAGQKELVLTGIHIGDYGFDLEPETNLAHTLREIFQRTKGQARIRISSLEPMELSPEVLEVLVAHSADFCDHFHLPLQSGSARILKLMRRSYTKEEYRETVLATKRAFPEAQLGADVIVGFPSESDVEFLETMDFIQDIGLHYIHVFPYSKRPNTAAIRMPGHLTPEVIKQRTRMLQELSNGLNREYYQRFIGREQKVLWENSFDDQGRQKGLTANYLNVVGIRSEMRAREFSSAVVRGFVGDRVLLV